MRSAVHNAHPNSTLLIVLSLAITGTNFFAGTDDGVFVSTNTGASWTSVSSGFPALSRCGCQCCHVLHNHHRGTIALSLPFEMTRWARKSSPPKASLIRSGYMTMNSISNGQPIDAGVSIGHVHLKVSDLEKSLAFYCGVLGFELTGRFGKDAAFISAGGYHHHIGLNTWESRGGSAPPPGSTGLYHVAIRYPNRASLGDAMRRLANAGIALDGASDHGVSEALYLRDPDDNGLELYWDRPRNEWPTTPDGKLAMYTRPLDVRSILEAADAKNSTERSV